MPQNNLLRSSLIAAAVATAIGSAPAFAVTLSTVQGTVGGALFTPPVFADTAAASAGPSTSATVYAGATVFFDYNGNGVLDPGEPSATVAANGTFKLISTKGVADLVALIPASGSTPRNVLRAKAAQVQAATVNPALPATVYITPLSTEVALDIENNGTAYQTAVNNLAQRINVSPDDVLLPPTMVQDATELPYILKESVLAQNRLQLAAKFVDRGDTVGELRGNFDCPNQALASTISGTTANTSDGCAAGDTATVGIAAAEQYAFNLEGMPRYDYVFVIIEENESQYKVQGSAILPYINSVLQQGSTFENYFATGNPSEPNYLALGGADDWGTTTDEGIPYPALTGVRANIWNSIDAAGLSWHVYEGSMWPSAAGTQANVGAAAWNTATGGLWFDNPAESSIVSADGTKSTYGSGLRAMKHNPAVWFADAAAQPDFATNSRSVSGAYGSTDLNGNVIPYAYPSNTSSTAANNYTAAGNWDTALQTYATTNGITSWWSGNTQAWTQDQLKQDLLTGTVANYNFIVPDQDDDMHNAAAPVQRADYWAQNVITKIEQSSIWKDPTKRVAIVVTFDEGESVSTACCGWNPERSGDGASAPISASGTFVNGGTVSTAAAPLISGTEAWQGKTGTTVTTYDDSTGKTSNFLYSKGNHGHGVTLFGLYTNQQAVGAAPTGNYDTDYYSHFSFVRTLQDIFALSDPGQPGTYVNRSKYTEAFIEQNSTLLPEFAGSANPHFDAVRAMNHVYAFPAGAARVNETNTGTAQGGVTLPVSTGPDATQTNLWATHK